MVGITSVEVKESLEDLAAQLRQVKTPKEKERLQVLYWLKQDKPPSISAIAKATGRHRNTLQTWLMQYRSSGVKGMLEVKQSPGGVRVIPQWAENALQNDDKTQSMDLLVMVRCSNGSQRHWASKRNIMRSTR